LRTHRQQAQRQYFACGLILNSFSETPTVSHVLSRPARAARRLALRPIAHSALLYAAFASQVHADDVPAPVTPRSLAEVNVVGTSAPGVTEKTRSYTTEAMSTATGLPLSIRETPQSVSVITRQMMDDQGVKTSADALLMAPGVSVTRSDATRYAFSARGFPIDNYQFDGLTQPVLSPWEFGENNLDLAVFDRVEIVRGATGLMTGAGNPSAAVNYVRKRPGRDFAASAGVSAGSWNRYHTYADVSTPFTQDGRVRGRIVAAYGNEDSHVTLLNAASRTLYGVVSADLGRATELTGGLSLQSTTTRGFGSGFPLFFSDGTRTNFDRSVSNNTGWGRGTNAMTTGFLDLTHQFDNRWKARAAYNTSVTDTTLKYLFRGGYPDRTTGLGTTSSFSYYDGKVRRNVVNLTASGPVQGFGRTHEVSIGWTRSTDHIALPERDILGALPDAGSFFDWAGDRVAEPVWAGTTSQADDLHNRQSGTYVVGRFSLADPLHLIVGGRVSNWETDQTYFGTKRAYRHKNEFVPYAGLIFDVGRNYSVYASYTEIFKPQNNRNEQGEILAPITGKSVEIGTKAAWMDGRLNGAAALFQTQQDNLAERTGQTVIGSRNTAAFRPVKGAKVEGLDLELGGEVMPGWSIATSYTTHLAKDANGAPINTSKPRNLFKLFSTYRLPNELNRFVVGGGVTWQNRMYQDATAPGNRRVRVAQSSYALVNLMAKYEVSKTVTASINVNNLFDKTYHSQIGFYNQGWYGAPRNVMLSLRAQY
jgi:outer membrane receptor for ferric coprogen and ferric-rhodotorulic acid